MKVSISKLVPNPYRNIDEYPLHADKIEQLRKNYQSTGFWGNIVCRKAGDKYEIAYGHHRLRALQDEYSARTQVEVIVRKLTNEQMLQMMAQENMEEFGTSAFVEAETVQATIDAAEAGEITLPKRQQLGKKGMSDDGHAFSESQVAEFLGWTKSANDGKGVRPNAACKTAFEMLDAIDAKVVTRKQLKGLSRRLAHELVSGAMALKREQERLAKDIERKAKEAEESGDNRKAGALKQKAKAEERKATQEAKEFVQETVGDIKAGNLGVRQVREKREDRQKEIADQNKQQRYKSAAQHLEKYRSQLMKTVHPDCEPHASMLEMLEGDYGLADEHVKQLRAEVVALSKRAEAFANWLSRWGSNKTNRVPQKLLSS